MTLPAHIASGYLISKMSYNNPIFENLDKSVFTAVVIAASLLPDIDGLFGGYLKDHRYTPFHAPLFWLVLLIVVYSIGVLINNLPIKAYTIAIGVGVFPHLLIDWYSGRTAGIMLFYPFSKQIFSLFPLNPDKGTIPVFPNKQHIEFWKFYMENKFLFISEIAITLSALTIWVTEKLRLK